MFIIRQVNIYILKLFHVYDPILLGLKLISIQY